MTAVCTVVGLGLLLFTPGRTAEAQSSPDSVSQVVLVGVTLFDGTGTPARPNQSVLIEGERIAAIFPTGSRTLPAGAKIYDLTGRYLIPGLIDTHVHVATDPSGEDSRPRTERRLRGALLGGVTAVRDMAGDVRALASLQRDALLGEIASPDIYYAALFAGPAFFADPRTHDASRGLIAGQVPWMRAITDTTDIHQAVAEARGTGATAIKLYAALSGELARRITTEAHAQGLLVWAHAALRPARPIDVVEAGVDAISHASLVALAMDSARRADGAARAGEPAARPRRCRPRYPVRHDGPASYVIFEPTLLVFADRASRPPPRRRHRESGASAGRDHHRRHRHPGCRRFRFAHLAQPAPGAGAPGDPGRLEPGGSTGERHPRCGGRARRPGASAARSRSASWPTWWCCDPIRCATSAILARFNWS